MSVNEDSQYSLNWNGHMNHVRRTLAVLLAQNEFVDVTLCCEGGRLPAHKMLLSVCSQFFLETFRANPCPHPIVILKGVSFKVMRDLLKFMYDGEVHLESDDFQSFLEAAKLLQVYGLTECSADEVIKQNLFNLKRVVREQEIKVEDNMNTGNMQIENEETADDEATPAYAHVSENMSTFHITDTKILPQSEPPEHLEIIKPTKEILQSKPSITSLHLHRCFSSTAPHIKRKLNVEKHTRTANSSSEIEGRICSQNQLKCNLCPKKFIHANSLKQHMQVHKNGTRCPVCTKVLSRKYQLRLHLKMKHGIDVVPKMRSVRLQKNV